MRHTLVSLSLVGLMVAGIAGGLRAQTSPAKPTIVLVHGAFADGSRWERHAITCDE